MELPGVPSLIFLGFLVIVMPWGAWRTARRLRSTGAGPAVTREQYWRGGVITQLMLLTLAWLTGISWGYRIFAVDGVELIHAGYAVGALVVCLAMRAVSRSVRSGAELRQLSVYERAPRTAREQAWFTAAVLIASVAEEAAYRGVGFAILWYAIGSPWVPALVMAIAFTLAHWNQGWKSGVTILAFALVFHALVALTGTLIWAMLVHATYDFIAGYEIRRQALMHDAEVRASASP